MPSARSCDVIRQLRVRVTAVRSGIENMDEANLLYVAVTRAKKRLILSPALLQLLDASGV